MQATDQGGTTDPTPASREFTVDTTPPDTAIDEGPSGVVVTTAASFAYSGSPQSDVNSFECKLDADAFTSCPSSGREYHHLAEGEHTFAVRAVDALGNADVTPASLTWTIDFSGDATPPDTTIVSGPDAVIGDTSTSFSFGSSEADSTFECSLDGASPSPCSSPHQLSGLSGGPHTFAVAATDPAGNLDPTPAEGSFEVDNTVPEASLSVTPSEGVAPLAVTVAVAGVDSRDDALEFQLDFGDGTSVAGDLPHANIVHTYEGPGFYLVHVRVTDGFHESVATEHVYVVLSEPLHADAGDDRSVVAGETVQFDGGGSRPQAGITRYSWDFGDGNSGTGRTPTHSYADPGTYVAQLEVHAGSESSTDEAIIRVLADGTSRLDVDVSSTSDGSPLGNADVLVIDASGQRFSAVTDGGGEASIRGLSDGKYTVYAAHNGYIDTSAAATVSGGSGHVAIGLEPGSVVAAVTTSERLDIEQIEALGIDPNDPENQNVYHVEVVLGGSGIRGYVNSNGGFRIEYNHGEWSSCEQPCRTDGWSVSFHMTGDAPMMQALKIPVKGSSLKEFFSVQMIVQNLGGPGIELRYGKASLELPDGLSLAPTASPQSLTKSMADIPSQGSATATWIVRGDREGEYRPTARYSGLVEPLGRSVSIAATLADPMKVWGASALRMIVQPENRVDPYRPYRVRVGLEDVADIPVYNPAIELSEGGAEDNFIHQPLPRLLQGTAEIEPGETFWTDDYILVSKARGRILPEMSFVKKLAGASGLQSTIEPVAQKPVAGATDHPVKDGIVLEFQPVEGATSYEIYRTKPDLSAPFADTPVNTQWLSSTKALVPADPAGGEALYAVSTLKGNKRTMYHQGVVDAPLDYWPTPVSRLHYQTDCTTTPHELNFSFEDPDFALGEYRIEVDGIGIFTGTVPGSGEVAVPLGGGLENGTRVTAWASNSEQGPGEHGPTLERSIGGCRYVALGDSFSSGEGVPDFEPGTNVKDVDTCHRSEHAYPHLLEDQLPSNWIDMVFRACSGAKIEDVTEKNQAGYQLYGVNEGPQIKYLDKGVQLVTLSIGGNDAYFKDVLTTCVAGGAISALTGLTRFSLVAKLRQFIPVCKPFWAGKISGAIASLRAQLPWVYTQLRREIDDNGKLIVVPYPELFPDRHTECWGIAPSDVTWLHETVVRANQAIKEAADEAGAVYADPEDKFEGHDVCELVGRWFNGVVPSPIVYSFHPNADGQKGLAQAVELALFHDPPGAVSHIEQDQTITSAVQLNGEIDHATFATDWDGSTVETTLIAPSGREITADSKDADVRVFGGPTYTVITIDRPEPGTWEVKNYGAEIPEGGEEVRFHSTQVEERNEPPLAVFTASQNAGNPPSLTVELNASESTDPDGAITSYQWDFGDGSQGSGPVVEHTYEGRGAYRPKLTVTDNESATASYEGEQILVTQSPVANDDSYIGLEGESVDVNAAGVLANDFDPDGGSVEVLTSTEAAHGQAQIELDGQLAYEPEGGFVGTDEVSYVAIDEDGALSSPAQVQIRVKVVPNTFIDSGPAGTVASANVAFAYSAASGIVEPTFQCRRDSGTFQACAASGKSLTGLSDGQHRFEVRVVDGDGQVDETPASRTFIVDTTAPDTMIDSGPSGPTNDASASFTFSSEAGARFECKLDSDAFVPCASPKVFSSLLEGSHTFEVRATDSAANTDPTPASQTFTVDTTPPNTTIDTTPTPQSPPPPQPVPEEIPGTASAAGSVQYKGGAVLLSLKCPGPGVCKGLVELTVREVSKRRGKRNNMRGVRRSLKRAGTIVVGESRFAILAGSRKVVKIRLNGKGRAMLRKAGKRGLRLKLAGTGIKPRTVVVKPANAKRKRKRARGRRSAR